MAKKTTKTGKALERQVASVYRAMGARKVEHDVELAGHQIDVYVEMETPDRARHRIAVEAKDYSRPVGIEIVSGFAAIVNGLRTLKLIDEGVIVSVAGFSRPARNAAKEHGLRLLEPADLEAMADQTKVSPPPYPETEDLKPRYRDIEQPKAADTELQAAELYERAEAAFQAERWKEAMLLYVEIERLKPGYRDVEQLKATAGEAWDRQWKHRTRLALAGLVALATVIIIVVVVLRQRPTLTIESHRDGDLVNHTEEITGTYRNLNVGWHLWSLVQPEGGDYWINDRLPLDQTKGEWRLKAYFGHKDTRSIGERFKFLVLAVEEGSDAEKYLGGADGHITDLPTERIQVFDHDITLTRASPTDRWLADFWDNEAWEGEPMGTQEITTTCLFQEWWGAPVDGMPENSWTARFVRRVHFTEDGEYCFDWVRTGEVDVSIDGHVLAPAQEAEDWWVVEHACRELTTGDHEIRFDYAKPKGEHGALEFWYDGCDVISPPEPSPGEWQAVFFPTNHLDGEPVWAVTLPGPFLEFEGEAGGNIPVVSFGAIFTTTLSPAEAGYYRFELHLDDGARFLIDGTEVLDEWHSGPGNYVVEKYLEADDHALRVEYYEYHINQYANITWERIPAPVPPVQRILFISDRDGSGYEILVADVNGANPIQLTHNTHADRDPAWSPDGRRIVFASDPEDDGMLELYVMDANGGSVTPLSELGYQPRWSPDGSRIAFVSERDGDPDIYVMSTDGTYIVNLTRNDAADYSPDWSPDGSRIGFETDRDDGDYEVYVMDADGSDPRNLSQNPDSWDGTPAWSPDGRRIAFASYRVDNTDIYVMDADGSNQRRMTEWDPVDKFPDWSADGRYLVFEGTDPESDLSDVYRNRPGGDAPRELLTDHWADHERPQCSPPGYGYTFESFTDGDDVNHGAIAVAGDYVWTGGSGGLMRWDRDDPNQQQKFTSENGLAENNVRDILADSETALWIGIGAWPFYSKGWSRYEFGEGHEYWRTYTSCDGLRADIVFDFYRDSQSRIWAGTDEGVWIYEKEEGEEKRWQQLDGPIDGWVTYMYQASDGAFWFELGGSDVLRYDPSAPGEEAWQRFNLMELLESDDTGYRHASTIVEGAPGEIWIGTNAGVAHYDGETWRKAGGKLDVWTTSAVRDNEGRLWFGTDHHEYGLMRLDPDGGQRTYTDDELTGNVFALFLDETNTLWAAGNGLNRYVPEEDRWEKYWAYDDQAHNRASAIMQDADGAFWFGHSIFRNGDTWGDGVSRYIPGGDDEWQEFDADDGLSSDVVHVIAQDRDGVIWFGFDRAGGGACRYDAEKDQWLSCYPADPNGLVSDEVDAIIQTRNGALWFGTSGGGLSRLDRGVWETFTQDNSGLLSNQVHCLAEDDKGALWLTTNRGANRFFYETDEWVPFTTGNSDLIADETLAVALDGSGGIWFGTTAGLSHLDIATGSFHNVKGTPSLPDWTENCSQALHVDRYGGVWVGTDEGLYRYIPEDGWLRLTTANGLASNCVLAIFEDADGAFWIGTPSGISRLRIGE